MADSDEEIEEPRNNLRRHARASQRDFEDVSDTSIKSPTNRPVTKADYSDSERTPEKYIKSESRFLYDESSRYGSSSKKQHSK